MSNQPFWSCPKHGYMGACPECGESASPLRCIRCNGIIHRETVEMKRRLSEKLHPDREVTPPKVCAKCLWRAITDIEDDE